MKRFLLAFILIGLTSPAARASDIGIDLHVRFGDPAPAPVHIAEPPLFLYPPPLGFYVAVGVPYHMYYLDGHYYLYRHDRWFIANHYGGPWHYIKHQHLPPGLAKRSIGAIEKHRRSEFKAYRSHRGGYGGRTLQPGPPGQRGKGRGH